jgi:hypothetical protein
MAIGDRRLCSTGRSISRSIVRDAAYLRKRAEEARALAEKMSPEYQEKMLEVGRVYDDLAREAERRERLAAADPHSRQRPVFPS